MKHEHYRIWSPEEYSYEHAFGFIPKIATYLHEDGEKRPCVIVVPGGAYRFVSPTESELVALKFYEMGYQAFVLTYTVNYLKQKPLKLQPLKDISRAVRLIRKRANEFGVLENKVAVCGFSAGGHLCASLCVHHQDIEDEAYQGYSNRPDVGILSYPVILTGENAHRDSVIALLGEDATEEELRYMSLDTQVTEAVPPCFVWATETDDAVPVENSQAFVNALREKSIRCAFHMFSSGAHGMCLATEEWADGKHMPSYPKEQIVNLCEKAKKGEVDASPEVFDFYLREHVPGTKVGIPNPEVAVWPVMADIFMK